MTAAPTLVRPVAAIDPAPFNLSALVSEHLRSSTLPDPKDIAAVVYAAIPRADRDKALLQALRIICQVQASRERSNTEAVKEAGQEPAPSWRVQGIRDGWARRLNDRMKISDGDTGWKLLADCTYDDLMAVALARRELAVRVAAKGDQAAAWAKAMKKARVERFGDLPTDVLRSLLMVTP